MKLALRQATLVGALVLAFSPWILSGCSQTSAEAKKAKHVERAESYVKEEKHAEAIIEYRNALQIDPNDADTHYRLALTYLKMGGASGVQGAFGELTRTVELNPSNLEAQLMLGDLYLQAKKPAKARERAEVILASTPTDSKGLALKGQSLIMENKFEKGIEALKKAIRIEPDDASLYMNLARAFMQNKNYSAAEETLKQGLSTQPLSTKLMLALGDLHLAQGKHAKAEAEYKRALEINPEKEELYVKLAGFYHITRKWPEEEAIYRSMAEQRPQDETPHILLGDFYTWLGNREKALISYQQAVEIRPDSTIARDKLISQYLDTGKLDEVEARTTAILKRNSRDLSGRYFDARLRLARGKSDEAISILQGVIKDEPQFALAHHFLGVGFLQKQQAVQARGAFTEAVKLDPKLPDARIALAKIHMAEGSADLAIEQAQAAIQINPRNVQAAIIAGDAYLLKGDIAKSKRVFEAITKALPDESIGPYRLGLVARTEQNDAKALEYFEEAHSKKPTAIEPLAQIAMIKIAQGKSNEARDLVTRQIEASPNNPLLYSLLGQLWMNAKNHRKAETAFKKAIELDISLLPAYLNLGQVYYQTGKTDQAIKEYEAVLVKNPKVIQAHMLLGVIHESRKEYDNAQAHYEAILKLDSRFASAANNLAWILAEQGGNLDVALSHAQTAREGRPDDPYVADTLGWIYYKKNAYLLAVSLLKEAVEKLSDEPVVHFHLGMAQYKNGDPAGAKRSLQAALKLSKNFPGSEEAKKMLAEL